MSRSATLLTDILIGSESKTTIDSLAVAEACAEKPPVPPFDQKLRRVCRHPGCNRVIKSQGFCQRHGAKVKRCKVENCKKQSQGTHGGYCKSHWNALHGKESSAKSSSTHTCPEGQSIYAVIIPQSIAYRPLTFPAGRRPPPSIPLMPLVLYLRQGRNAAPGWHRDSERRARGVGEVPPGSVAPLEPWERQLDSKCGMYGTTTTSTLDRRDSLSICEAGRRARKVVSARGRNAMSARHFLLSRRLPSSPTPPDEESNEMSRPSRHRGAREKRIIDHDESVLSDSPRSDESDQDDFFDDHDEDVRHSRLRQRLSSLANNRRQRRTTRRFSPQGQDHDEAPVSTSLRRAGPSSSSEEESKRSPFYLEEDSDDESMVSSEGEASTEPLKIQRILATRTETKQQWKEICARIQTSEISRGSRWYQDEASDDEDVFEERFLVKWADISFLHCSWETKDDLTEHTDNAKHALAAFFRKSVNGVFFSAEERMDGDYFDPAYVQIERILEIDSDGSLEKEDSLTNEELGIILDPNHPKYDEDRGRQFLVKWCNMPYTECTYEFEQDFILNDVDYKEQVKSFLRRSEKPDKRIMKAALTEGEQRFRELYKIFGDNHRMSEEQRQAKIKEFQNSLGARIYKNGGQVRDYQAEGIAWMISNYVNDRSSILADEMGLGKTIQTASTVEYIAKNISPNGVFLIVAPLSTLTHWQREFLTWTDLNAIIYHGSADNRIFMREIEFTYECDRPRKVSSVQQYLRRCSKPKMSSADSPWMVDVVITSPEMLMADDAFELSAIEWELLIVDEAHRLKNHTSKLAVNLRDTKFRFKHRILLTGTPIQNNVEEFWTLLNFIDPDEFEDRQDFADKYGNMKSSEQMEKLHEEIRPYILRRLKEDVEKSVPPKEETLIEVELTLTQKQYYRAIYEKNLKFLNKGGNKADKVTLNNLCMELRKVCNHLFLLNGVEELIRSQDVAHTTEADFLVNASGKLVLLDKLLPRLKAEGHRVLLFSQFKIMLDILEDYFHVREFSFERIDGSITGHKRQQAIDRFQKTPDNGREPPFIMMLTTKAGGVGITLTAADTCIIFDSDWNPQNDLQAQARCHRIGQTKDVKIYRLLTSKTYEMQMFHMSSLKMGLDQAVLKGFESNSSSEPTLSKEEIERLLRYGAYDIFSEEKTGSAEAASRDFVEQDIDAILARRSRKVVHENTGSEANVAGGTFSKATFKVNKSPGKDTRSNDVDISDPDFWTKMVGEVPENRRESNILVEPRRRNAANYSEVEQWHVIEQEISVPLDSDEDSDYDEDAQERARWGGKGPTHWKKEDAEVLCRCIQRYGYDPTNSRDMGTKKKYPDTEIKRMSWAMVLVALLDASKSEVSAMKRREEKQAEKLSEESKPEGGVLAERLISNMPSQHSLQEEVFRKLIETHKETTQLALAEATHFARTTVGRDQVVVDRAIYKKGTDEISATTEELQSLFIQNVWGSLKVRGWKVDIILDGTNAGQRRFFYDGEEYQSIESVLITAGNIYPELANVIGQVEEKVKASHQRSEEYQAAERQRHLQLNVDNLSISDLISFLDKYAPLQLMVDRQKQYHMHVPRRLLTTCTILTDIIGICDLLKTKDTKLRGKSVLPHPQWTQHHDIVLLQAIAKHGWVDADDAYSAIINDTSFAWGAPFDVNYQEPFCPCLPSGVAETSLNHIMNTAQRAANTLSNHIKTFEVVKGFSVEDLVENLCLVKTSGEDCRHQWSVDKERLQLMLSSKQSEPLLKAELPDKKSLVKRVKAMIDQLKGNESAPPASGDSVVPTMPPYTPIDLSDTANYFLIWLLKLSVKSSSKYMPKVLELSKQEAKSRMESLKDSLDFHASTKSVLANKVADLEDIIKTLDLVRRSKHASALQAKNVLRALIGEPIKQSRDDSSPFIVAKRKFGLELSVKGVSDLPLETKSKTAALQASTNSQILTTGKLFTSNKTLAEKSLESGRVRVKTLEAVTSCKELMVLSEVEAVMISTMILVGLPFETVSTGNNSWVLTWTEFHKHLLSTARNNRSKIKTFVSRQKKTLATTLCDDIPVASDSENPPRADSTHETIKALDSLEGSSHDTVSTIEAYEESAMIKKLVLLLGKLLKTAACCTSSAAATSLIRMTGPKVLKAFDATVLSLADHHALTENGHVMAYTAVDFGNLHDMQATVALNAYEAQTITAQIATLTQGRMLLSLHKKDSEILPRLDRVSELLRKQMDASFLEPEEWMSCDFRRSSPNDLLLLRRLLTGGYESVMSSRCGCDLNDLASMSSQSFRDIKLTKGGIQVRATQLVRELYLIEYPCEPPRSMGATATTTDTKKKKKSITPKATGGQMGLMAFFQAKDKIDKENSILSSASVSSPANKRKDDGTSDESSAEKKCRVL